MGDYFPPSTGSNDPRLPSPGASGTVPTSDGNGNYSLAVPSGGVTIPASGVVTSDGTHLQSTTILPMASGGTGINAGTSVGFFYNGFGTPALKPIAWGTTTFSNTTSKTITGLTGITGSSVPIVTPQASLGTTAFWATVSSGSITIHTSAAVSISFSWMVIGP